MAISVTDINFELKNINNRLDLSEITSAASSIASTINAASSTQLGFGVGEVKGGFESLVQLVDNPLGRTSISAPAISRATADVPGVKQDLVQPLSGSETTDLNAIVESSVAPDILNEIIVAGTPESIASAFSATLGKTTAEIEDCMTEVAPPDVTISLKTAVDNIQSNSLIGPLLSGITNLGAALTGAVGGLTSGNIFLNILENYSGGVTNQVIGALQNPNKDLVQQVVISILDNDVEGAVNRSLPMINIPADLVTISTQIKVPIDTSNVNNLLTTLTILELAGGSSLSVQSVIDQISTLQTTYTQATVVSNNVSRGDPALGTPSPDRCVPIGNPSSSNTTGASNTDGGGGYDTDFSYVDSLEEMTADLRAISRPVSTVVVHWTANYIDDNHIDAQIIKDMHIARGWSTIGYHYIIRRDGSLQRGRNPNRVGAHAKNSHNPYSIGISFVGGYNCPNGTRNPESYVSPDSINSAQWSTLDMFLKAFYTVYPGGEVWGHQDTDPWNKIDPMTNMSEYVKNKFGKTNISPQPSRTYSLEELASRTFDPVRTSQV